MFGSGFYKDVAPTALGCAAGFLESLGWNGYAAAQFMLYSNTQTQAGLMPRPERACEPLLGSDDGKWIFESIFATLEKRSVAKAARK